MANILISGGSGLLGRRLTSILTEKGHHVSILSRSRHSSTSVKYIVWDVEKQILPPEAVANTEIIIHLAGAGIADHRWTNSYKKKILASRTASADLIFQTLKNNTHKVHTFLSASAVGYYGHTGNVWIDELEPAADDFMGNVCKQWEKSALQFESLKIRVALLRTGVVLSDEGGALPVLARTVTFFAGAPLGNGDQYIPWIHIDDICKMYLFLIENKTLHGAFNANAPSPLENTSFMTLLGRILKRPIWPINVPAFLLKIILGEKSAVILNGQRTSAEKIKRAGFIFDYSDPEIALRDLLLK